MNAGSPDPSQDLDRFFGYIWGAVEGFVYLPTKDSEGKWKKTMYKWPLGREQVVEHVLTSTASSKEVYFSPAIYSTHDPKQENVMGSNVLWADFDGTAPIEWPSELGEAGSEAHRAVDVPPPTLRIQSSAETHQHVYWKLDEFTKDIAFIQEKNRAIAYSLGADTSGWDANQILRPPHTFNFKRNMPVVVAEEREEVYRAGRFDGLKSVKTLVTESLLSLDKVVPVDGLLANYSWDKDTFSLFTTDSIREGERSSALMKLGYFGAEQGMKDEEIFSILVDADNRWGKFVKRSDRVRRLSEIVNRARLKHPVPVNGEMFGALFADSEQVIEVDTRYVWGFQDFINAEFHVEWRIKNLMESSGIGLICSAPGVGKTQIGIQMGIHVALGKDFLKYEPVGQSNVGFVSLEMSKVPIKYLFETIAKGYDDTDIRILQERFHVVPFGEPMPLDRPEGKVFFEKMIVDHKWDMVFIDSLGKMTGGELSDDTAMRKFFSYLASVRNKYGVSFVIVHHNRKGTSDNKKPRELNDVFGSQYITSEPDFVLSLWRERGRGNDIEVSELKNRLAAQREPFSIRRTSNLAFEYQGEVTLDENANFTKALYGKEGGDGPQADGGIFNLG